MAPPNVEAKVSQSIRTTIADMVDDDSVQDSESDWPEEEESEEGEDECDYCFTPMEGRIGETVECPNCELGCKIIRRTRLDESSEASSATVSDLLTLEVIAAPQVDDHADPTKPDNETEQPKEPRKIGALSTQGVFHDDMEWNPCQTVEARGIETEDVVKFTHSTEDEVQAPINAEAAVESN